MPEPTRIAWVDLPATTTFEPVIHPDFDFVRVRVEDITAGWFGPQPRAVVLNLHPENPANPELSVEKLRAAVTGCPLPVLLRVPSKQFGDAFLALRETDDVCLREDPPLLVAHRIRHLMACNDLDPLTQLLNRRAFSARLEETLRAASPDAPLSLLFLDLDHFKRINDERGFHFGDRVLEACARLLPNGDGVLAARLGGEEFTILTPGLDASAALQFADGVCETFAAHRGPEGITVTTSIGVATTDGPGIQAEELMRQGDTALYAAKNAGRNRAIHFRELERQARDSGGDVRIRAFETAQRVINERAIETIARRGRLLLEELQRRADHDGLTGLFNRGYLDRRLPRSCEEARDTARPLCVALIDIDHFGAFNKQYGWPTGDRTLREVADIIRQNVRAGDWVAKYGGEEIAVVLSATHGEAVAVIERVRNTVAQHPFRSTEGKPLTVTISAGVVPIEPDETPTQLWDRVSVKVNEAKRAGRNQVRF